MIKNGIVALFVVLILFFLKSHGQELPARDEEPVTQLTLKMAIERALQQNLNLKQSSNQVRSSALNFSQRKNNFWPDLRASLSVSQRYDRQYDALDDRTSGHDARSLSAGIQSSLNLFNGFADVAALQKARYNLDAVEFNYQRQKEFIIFQTIAALLGAIEDAELIDIEIENLDAQRNQLQRIEEFHKRGKRPISDLLQQRADIAEAELRLLNAEQNYEISRLNLLEIMAESPERNYALIAPGHEIMETITAAVDEGVFAFEKRSDWLAQERQIAFANQSIKEAMADFWPAIGLNLSLGSGYSSDRESLNFSRQFNEINPSASVGLSFSIPLFDRWRTQTDIQLAKIQLDDAQLELQKLKLAISLEIQEALLNYQTAVKQKQTALARLDFAGQTLDVMEARYNVGSATYVELSQIRANHLRSAYEYVQAEYNVLLRRVALSYARGTIEFILSELHIMENQE